MRRRAAFLGRSPLRETPCDPAKTSEYTRSPESPWSGWLWSLSGSAERWPSGWRRSPA